MATWNHIRFYYQTMLGSPGSTLTATTTAAGDYSVNYLFNMMEINSWLAANTTSPCYITYDAGSGNSKTADYLALIGHNLFSAGATVSLQYSDDNTNWSNAFTAFAPTANTVCLKEFTQTSAHRYWRLAITGTLSSAPYLAVCIWGNMTDLDWATTDYDPYGQQEQANVNLSQGGYAAGIHLMYIERQITFNFDDADSTLYGKIKAWRDAVGIGNFFVGWETANNPNDVWLLRRDPSQAFVNPLKTGGAYRNITLNLLGRKE